MTQDIHDIVENYVIKHPDLNYTEIADLILEDKASDFAHRTLRRYAAEVCNEKTALLLSSEDDEDFYDITDCNITKIEFEEEALIEGSPTIPKRPRILFLDIETARMIVGVWNIGYKVNIGPEQIIQDFFIYGFAARWYGSNTTISSFVTSEEAKSRDDARIMIDLWRLLESADIVCSHNGNRFDLPKIRTRFIMNGLPPVSSFRSIDTYQLVSKQFAFASNALKHLAHVLTSKEKINTNYNLWIACEKGDQDALDYMEKYCIGDIDALVEVYVALRGWFKGHPNLGVFIDSAVACCPNCGSEDIEQIESIYTTQQNAFPEVRCNTCGAVNRTRDSLISTERRKVMLIPAAH